MRYSFATSVLALAAAVSAGPALAQTEVEDGWTGFYIGGSFGGTLQGQDQGSNLQFDTNLDGTYGDTVRTAPPASADAFAPGFCGGAALANNAGGGCRNDKDGLEYFVNAGYDRQMGNFVVGIVGEFGKNDIRDSTTGFSSTPAAYTFTRTQKYAAGLRLRAGYTPQGKTLFYATGGGAYAKLRHSFATTNTANSFTGNRTSSNAWGWSAGGGVDQKIAPNFSIGLQYLYTKLKDDNYAVRVGPGTAPLTNPFRIVNPNGTDMRRSDTNFSYHSMRVTAAYRF